ncbi:MAG: hypothetical protein ACREYE_13780 [Gammaproteobacteria bacterium]
MFSLLLEKSMAVGGAVGLAAAADVFVGTVDAVARTSLSRRHV